MKEVLPFTEDLIKTKIKEMNEINYQSDFDFILHLYPTKEDAELKQNELPFPTYDFTISLYTTSKANSYIVSKKGDKLKNCFNDEGRLHIVCDSHGLNCGKLEAEFIAELPDGMYPDGTRREVFTCPTNIRLIRDRKDTKAEDVEMIFPYVFITAYQLAKSYGYKGTEEEYTHAINTLPEAATTAEYVGSFVQEWAKGKENIIDSLKKWGMEADRSDSFDDLSQKILDLPVKGENEDGVIPHTYNGTNSWDLLNELNNNQRKDYPYCYAVEIGATPNLYELRNADAYYTSDGHFYESDVDHIFEESEKATNYIIFYFRESEYLVMLQWQNQLRTIALNGRPRFQMNNTSLRCGVVESYTEEKYELVGTSDIFKNSAVTKIALSGVEAFSGGVLCASCASLMELYLPAINISSQHIVNGCNNLTELFLPSLEYILGGAVAYSCSGLSHIYLPNLKEIINGWVSYSCDNITELSLPSLTRIDDEYNKGGGCIARDCSKLTKIDVPVLETIRGTSNYIIYDCDSVTELNLPSIKTWSGANIITNRSSAKEITINLPSLFSTSNIALNITNTSTIGEPITVNLGKPDGGWIYLSASVANARSRIQNLTVQPGFRSYLRADMLTSLTKESLEAIIDNLADNTQYDTLQIVFGATNLAKVSDEYKLMATNKNYTLS